MGNQVLSGKDIGPEICHMFGISPRDCSKIEITIKHGIVKFNFCLLADFAKKEALLDVLASSKKESA